MDLRWWPIALAGILCLAACFAMAVLIPLAPDRRRLRPLANIGRLTRLPEYARAARLRSVSTVATLVLLVVLFGAAVVAGARPTGTDTAFDRDHPRDVMLCVAARPADPATGAFLRHYAAQAGAFQTERIGLTSTNARLVPLTRDYQYAAAQFTSFAQAGQDSRAAARFSPPVRYVDYAAGVDDVLALCLTGFPDFERNSTHRRSVVYLGPPTLRAPGEQRPALFDSGRVAELAGRAGAQINVITTADDPALRALTERTGGEFAVAGTESAVTDAADRIAEHPAPLVLADGTRVTGGTRDAPVAVLAIVLVATAALTVTLVVLRR